MAMIAGAVKTARRTKSAAVSHRPSTAHQIASPEKTTAHATKYGSFRRLWTLGESRLSTQAPYAYAADADLRNGPRCQSAGSTPVFHRSRVALVVQGGQRVPRLASTGRTNRARSESELAEVEDESSISQASRIASTAARLMALSLA